MGRAVNTEPCLQCRKSGADAGGNNLVNYEDGSKYCFACAYWEKSETLESTEEHIKSDDIQFLSGNYDDLPTRGISKKITKFLDYKTTLFTGNLGGTKVNGIPVHVESFKNNLGQLVAQKIRGPKKEFKILGDSKDMELYGQWIWEPTDKLMCVVTEGVLDQASILEIQGTQYPVVSIPNGASSAVSAIKRSLEWLSGWKYVVLAFDNDAAGIKATKECLEILEPGKVRVLTWPLKDANEMLLAGRGSEFKNLIWNAKEIKPDGIVSYADVREKVLTPPKIGLDWPWRGMTNLTYGIRPHELITIMAASGQGKTETVAEIFIHLIQKHGVKCGVMSFEQPPHKTLQRAIGKLMNKRLHVPGAEFDPAEVDRIGMNVFQDKLFCYERAGTVDWNDVRSKLVYYAKSLDCKLVVIDNLSSIASKFDTDERRGIDRAMLELSELVMTLEITIILVCHISRDKEKKFDEGAKITLRDARGSEGIGQHSTYVFGLERNSISENEEERNITTMRCLKDREFGTARGQWIQIKYSPETGRLTEI